ncbi:MAG: BlaI/MecI/CopY family transcriptional regulator [Defluviitaleaceae bacterium]|nr:BlaI/MecI/CopY family transcriptional regulator [Defluviitaleaceae bacterium]
MKLTSKELEIMSVLWNSKISLTASEIVEASVGRTWKEGSIYIFLGMLEKKGAIAPSVMRPSTTKSARTYKPTLTYEQYTVSYIRHTGITVDVHKLIEHLLESEAAPEKG